MVAALMSGDDLPVADDLAQALALARDARVRAPDQSWGYIALCDIAERIGDEAMLQDCSGKLQGIAPKEEETRRALAFAASLGLRWWQLLGWLAVAAAAVGTAAHALWRRSRRPGLTGQVALAVLLLVAVPVRARANAPPEARGDVSSWKIDDADPEKSIPSAKDQNRDPVEFGYWLMDLTARAAGAAKRGDHQAAIRYYTAMAKAVPDRSVAFTKLCTEYEAVNERAKAVAACGMGLFREGVTVNDYVHYTNLVLTTPGPMNTGELTALTAVIKHLREDPTQVALADELECETGVRADDATMLEECTKAMTARAPNEPKTMVYQWNLAMQRHQYDAAREIIAHAKTVRQMKPDAISLMESETAATVEQRNLIILLGGGLLVVLGIAGTFGAKFLLARRRDAELRPA